MITMKFSWTEKVYWLGSWTINGEVITALSVFQRLPK